MACAVLTYGNAGMSCAELNVEVRITDSISDLLKSTACKEHCEGACENGVTRRCKTCGNAYHITFGDSCIKKSIRECLFKHACFCCGGKIGVHNNKALVLLAELNQSFTVSFSCCCFDYVCHLLRLQFCKLCFKLVHSLLILLGIRSRSVP